MNEKEITKCLSRRKARVWADATDCRVAESLGVAHPFEGVQPGLPWGALAAPRCDFRYAADLASLMTRSKARCSAVVAAIGSPA